MDPTDHPGSLPTCNVTHRNNKQLKQDNCYKIVSSKRWCVGKIVLTGTSVAMAITIISIGIALIIDYLYPELTYNTGQYALPALDIALSYPPVCGLHALP